MIKIVKSSHTVDTRKKTSDLEGYELKCGDKVIYYRNVGSPVRGWFLGKSISGKTNYILTTEDRVIKPYYDILKYQWREISPDPKFPQTFKRYEDAQHTLALVLQPEDLKKKV